MKAIVYGIRNYYKVKKEEIEKKYEIIGFIDGSVDPSCDDFFEGKKLLHPSRASEFGVTNIILCSAKQYEMWENIRDTGIRFESVICGTDFEPPYDAFEETLKNKNGRLYVEDSELKASYNDKTSIIIGSSDAMKTIVRDLFKDKTGIEIIKRMPLEPISRRFGLEYGTSISRVYIERLIENNADKIHGDVLEIADDYYTKKYGNNINKSLIMHVNGWGENVVLGNLATGEGIVENVADCFICTQTIQVIYDIKSVVKNIYKLLKPGGYVILTAHGISQLSMYDYRNWGEYWRFTDKTIYNLFSEYFDREKICVSAYGNVKTAASYLYGLCAEELEKTDFEYDDPQYQLMIGCVARK